MVKKRMEKFVIPKWDNWHIRLSDPKEQIKIIDLFISQERRQKQIVSGHNSFVRI